MKSIVSLLFLTKQALSNIICQPPACFLDGTQETYIATSEIETMIIDCGVYDCSLDTTSGERLRVYTGARETILRCPTQDSCTGVEVYCGIAPEGLGYLDTDFDYSGSAFGLSEFGSFIMECDDDIACKEAKIIAKGNTQVHVKAMGKSSFDASTLDCLGLSNGRFCELTCNNNDIEPCKNVKCDDENNCVCYSEGLGGYDACPPKPVITLTPLKPVTISATTKAPTTPPKPYETCTGPGTTCEMTGEARKTFICPNWFDSCIINCVDRQSQCQNMKVISGASQTIVRCTRKDSCKNVDIEIGSYTLATFTDFNQDMFEGTKAYAYIQCGSRKRDDTACKDMYIKAYGVIEQYVKVDARSRRAFQGGQFDCDIDERGFGLCQLDCFYSRDSSSCPDVTFDCLTLGTKCECTGLGCPQINLLGDSSCDNESVCEIEGHGGRIVIPSTVDTARIDCQRLDKQCLDARVYTGATQTAIECGEEGCYGMIIYAGEIPDESIPRGWTTPEFRNPAEQTLTVNCEFRHACKNMKVNTYGNINSYVWGQDNQAFEWAEYNCFADANRDCILNCLTYEETCDHSLFICPNVAGALSPPATGLNAQKPKTNCVCYNDVNNDEFAPLSLKAENNCPDILVERPRIIIDPKPLPPVIPDVPVTPPVTPDNGPVTPPVTPDNGPVTPPVTPDNGPVTPPVTPDNGPVTPPVTPDNGPVTPDVGPVTPPVTPDNGPVTPDVGPVTPDNGPVSPGVIAKQKDTSVDASNKGVPRGAFYPLVAVALLGLICVGGIFIAHKVGVTKSYFTVNSPVSSSLNSQSVPTF